jgi:hypothetical protein
MIFPTFLPTKHAFGRCLCKESHISLQMWSSELDGKAGHDSEAHAIADVGVSPRRVR